MVQLGIAFGFAFNPLCEPRPEPIVVLLLCAIIILQKCFVNVDCIQHEFRLGRLVNS